MDHPHFSWQTPLLDNIWDCLKVVMAQALYFSIIKERVGAGHPYLETFIYFEHGLQHGDIDMAFCPNGQCDELYDYLILAYEGHESEMESSESGSDNA